MKDQTLQESESAVKGGTWVCESCGKPGDARLCSECGPRGTEWVEPGKGAEIEVLERETGTFAPASRWRFTALRHLAYLRTLKRSGEYRTNLSRNFSQLITANDLRQIARAE